MTAAGVTPIRSAMAAMHVPRDPPFANRSMAACKIASRRDGRPPLRADCTGGDMSNGVALCDGLAGCELTVIKYSLGDRLTRDELEGIRSAMSRLIADPGWL